MNIQKFDDMTFKKCCVCNNDSCRYISNKCLHKLCEDCYNTKFKIHLAEFVCEFCSKIFDRNIKLTKDNFDVLISTSLKQKIDKDKEKRDEIFKISYKIRENFSTEEEYNEYLAYIETCIEKCIQNKNEKDLREKYPQSAQESKENREKRESELDSIKEKMRIYDPKSFNNSKFIICESMTIKEEEENFIYEPVQLVKEPITLIPNLEKEKVAGGYDIIKLNEFFKNFSLSVLRNKK